MYKQLVNTFRIVCPDGTVREPTPREVASVVGSCKRIALDGSRAPSSPELRKSERAGNLKDAVKISRRLDKKGVVAHTRRIVAVCASEIVSPTL